MKKQLQGISLLLAALLFYQVSDAFQAYLWSWGIGVTMPWALIAVLIGISGLVLVFSENETGSH